MYVISEIKDKAYKNLIEYAYTKCDAVMFVIRKDLYTKEKDKNIINNFNNMISSISKLNDYLLKKEMVEIGFILKSGLMMICFKYIFINLIWN